MFDLVCIVALEHALVCCVYVCVFVSSTEAFNMNRTMSLGFAWLSHSCIFFLQVYLEWYSIVLL